VDVEPLASVVDSPVLEPLASVVDPPVLEPLASVVDPLASVVDPLASVVDPLASVVDPPVLDSPTSGPHRPLDRHGWSLQQLGTPMAHHRPAASAGTQSGRQVKTSGGGSGSPRV
jgi:hypothetical protein